LKPKKFDDLVIFNMGVFDSSLISTPISEKNDKSKKPQMKQIVPKIDTSDNPESFKLSQGMIKLGSG
jgi:hypothetical protein